MQSSTSRRSLPERCHFLTLWGTSPQGRSLVFFLNEESHAKPVVAAHRCKQFVAVRVHGSTRGTR
jgi:hypothetical protein